MKSIAEGIEDGAHVKALLEIGCEYGQGYHYSRPVPRERFDGLLAAGVIAPRAQTRRPADASGLPA